MDCRADELDYAEDSEVDSMLAAGQTSAEHIVVQSLQLPNGEVCPVVMGSGIVSQPVGVTGPPGESELDLKLTSDTLDHLRPGRAVIYRFEERGEIWLVQTSSADPTVLQVQATLDTGQLQYQQQHVQHVDATALPMALQTIDVGGTISMEMAGEELVGPEVTEVGGMTEVTSSSATPSAMATSDNHVDSNHSQIHQQLPAPVGSSHLNTIVQQSNSAATVHEHDQVQHVHEQLPSLLESDAGPLVGAEETASASSKSVIGAVTVNPPVTSVLQKK
ncbi:zinc finger protein-like, partial [Tropilaelaps mercedesae]